MGSDNVIVEQKPKYLPKSEIVKENNYILRDLFNKYKNYDGNINLLGLSKMTNNLIEKSTLEIIIKICCSKENKLLYIDFLYFYALLKTKIFDAKLNFILYFVFAGNAFDMKDNYIFNVKKFYQNSYFLSKILLNEFIINKEIIEKENVYNFIKNNYKEEFEKYQLNKEICNFSLDQEEEQKEEIKEENNISRKNSFNKHILINTNKYCLCLKHKNSVMSSVDFYKINASLYDRYDSIKNKFEEYKQLNNGIFPLTLLQEMLKEINISPSLIDLITNYIKKKAQKEIMTFELFKEVLSILTIPLDDDENKDKNKEIFTDGLFILFTYPNDYIEKTAFCSFIQLTNADYSLKAINQILNKYEIPKKITKEKFKEIIDYLINELIESLEHIKYIPYIFFDYNIIDRKIEKHCIDILLNGEDIKDYIMKKIKTEEIFYIIDYKFWENWNILINYHNYDEVSKLKINTGNICDQNGKINEGLVYLTDFIILTKKIYELFCKWYGKPLIEIERERISIEDEEENSRYYLKLNKEEKENSFIQYEDLETHKKYEIEIYPIFLIFLNFEELQIKMQNSLNKFKEDLKSQLENKNATFYKFSRKVKFSKIFKILQDSVNMELDENNSRLWIFYDDRLEMVQNKDTLERKGIFNKAVILLEINKSGTWPMDQFDSFQKEIKNEDIAPSGIFNIGNSCYMNSILQIFLNINEIKDIFINIKANPKLLNFLINYKSNKSILVEEFINLLIEKWIIRKKTLNPKMFKEICGKFNDNFKENSQQDANDFLNFLIQNLHEGTNLKTKETCIVNKEEIDTTENELGNEYWANTIRNNASYIYSLFIGQLQSKLICNKCQKCKIKYEPFSVLDLPLPEENNIVLYVKLFRLPLKLSPFLNKNKESKNGQTKIKKIKLLNYSNKNGINENNEQEKKSFDISLNEQVNLEMQTSKKLDFLNNSASKDELITNELNLNIPILLKIEISRKEQCEEIISTLKSMKELSLDLNNKYTKFIIISNGKNINPNLTIDQSLESHKQIEIYELLNFEGLKTIFNYNDLIDKNPKNINNQELNSTINIPNYNDYSNYIKENDEKEYKEILIEIKHRVRKNSEGDDYLVNLPVYSDIQTNRDFIILTNKESIKIYDLYEMIWEKYMYFCDMPAKLKNLLWWRNISNEIKMIEENENDEKENIKKKLCSPFLLKIINKGTKSCAYCSWFRLCTGCILDPNYKKYISIPKNCYLIVEWCRKVKLKQIKDENPLLCLNHSSLKTKTKDDILQKISIYDCLDLYTKKEIVDNVFCENCKEKRSFTKILKIERIPKYLAISLKRFKYTMMYRAKINSPIKFPINNINLNKYLVDNSQENSKIYDLYAVVNHCGNLTAGHYNTIIKQNNKWINYNDSNVSYFLKTFDTQNAYILIYKFVKDDNTLKLSFNFSGIMNTAFKIYLNQKNFEHIFNYLINSNEEIIEEYKDNCEFYYGEPVSVDNKMGYLINISEKDNDIIAKIKVDKDYLYIKNNKNKITKETIKDNNARKTNADKNTVLCNGNCLIF